MGQEVRGVRSTDRQLQKSPGDAKCSIGNGVAKELTHMTRGHEQWCGDCLREWGMLGVVGQWRKNQDNYHSIINKVQLKIKN